MTISWEHDSKLSAFLAKRTLRIFPGLIACVLLTAFLLGPAVSTLRPGDYFSSPGTYAYLANIGLYTVLRLPGVFETLQHDALMARFAAIPGVVCSDRAAVRVVAEPLRPPWNAG